MLSLLLIKDVLSKYFAALLAFACIPLYGVVLETYSVSEVLTFACPRTLVALDIDDTLIHYPYHLGSSAYFYQQWEKASSEGGEAIARFHEIAGLLTEKLSVAPVDPKTAPMVRYLQAQGTETIGLTARFVEHPGVKNWPEKTVEQVASIGISFFSSSPRICPKNVPLYHCGILFCNHEDKGKVLTSFIEQLDVPPCCVVFIDDRRANVESVDRAMADLGIRTLSFWFRGAEEWKSHYDPIKAADELDQLLEGAILQPSFVP